MGQDLREATRSIAEVQHGIPNASFVEAIEEGGLEKVVEIPHGDQSIRLIPNS